MFFRKMRAAAAFGLTASVVSFTPAVATAPSGLTVTPVVYGSFGTVQLNTADNKTDKWGMNLKTLDDTDVGVDLVSLDPGGTTGWHAHPSPVFVTVTQGSVVFSDGADPACPSHTYTAGQTFIEKAYAIHDLVNAGGSTAQLYGVHLNPTSSSGPGFLIDEDKPTNCP